MAAADPGRRQPWDVVPIIPRARSARQGRIRTRPSRGQERQLRELPAWRTTDVAVAERAVAAEETPGNGPAYQARLRSGGAAHPRWQGRSAGLPSGAGAGPREGDSPPPIWLITPNRQARKPQDGYPAIDDYM